MKEQIKEIARVLCEKYDTEHCKVCDHHGRCMVRLEAEWIYEAGYRKQSEGEWREDVVAFCNVCSSCRAMVDRYAIKCNSGKLHYCPNCGAHMKGGAE